MPENEIKFGIVVPCFNEENRIPMKSFGDYCDQNSNFYFLFSDDGSTDHTKHLLNQAISQRPRQFLMIHSPVNKGKATAVRNGILHLKNKVPCDYYGFLDADLAIPLSQLNTMQNTITENPGCDLLVSKRNYSIIPASSSVRSTLSRVYNRFINMVLPFRFYFKDVQCGCKMIKAPYVEYIFASEFLSKWLFDAEIIFRLHKLKPFAEIEEVEFEFVHANKDSKVRKRDYVKSLLDLFRLLIKYRI